MTAEYFTNASGVYTNAVNFNPTNLFHTSTDPVIDFISGPATSPNLSNGYYTVRWTGQIEPQFSETYTFQTRTDDGVKLWVNDQLLIDRWQTQNATWTNAISLAAGVRYNLRMEYFNRGGSARAQLSWYSPNQPRQVLPATRLYPASEGFSPGGVTSPLSAIALDFAPWMTPALTSVAGIPTLVDALNSLLCAGQLSPAVKTIIVDYVANPRFPYNSPTPTHAQMRDRVRAVVHLITTSPDFAVQR